MGNPISGERSAVRAPISTFYSRETWIEGRAEDQLAQVAGWPGMRAVAGFPDLHPGRFGPVGAAFLADRIWPQLVGPDIGCGIALFRLGGALPPAEGSTRPRVGWRCWRDGADP